MSWDSWKTYLSFLKNCYSCVVNLISCLIICGSSVIFFPFVCVFTFIVINCILTGIFRTNWEFPLPWALILTVLIYIMVILCMVKWHATETKRNRRNIEQSNVRGGTNIQTQSQPLTVEIPSAPTEQMEMAPLTVEIPSTPPVQCFFDLDRVIENIDLPPTYSECVMLSPPHYSSVDVNIPETPVPSYGSIQELIKM